MLNMSLDQMVNLHMIKNRTKHIFVIDPYYARIGGVANKRLLVVLNLTKHGPRHS